MSLRLHGLRFLRGVRVSVSGRKLNENNRNVCGVVAETAPARV